MITFWTTHFGFFMPVETSSLALLTQSKLFYDGVGCSKSLPQPFPNYF